MSTPSPLDWLYSTQLFGVKLGLDNIRRLLREALATPAPGVQVVHVAGTNGKGSVCALAESIARATGRHTGLFSSPHLVDFRERIRVSGRMIPENALDTQLAFLRDLVRDWDPHPTFFELALAAALRHFKDEHCELLVLETGMGGRLDATNAVPSDVSVITPIGMDHQEWLGDSLAAIATEKAGIIKAGKPVVTSPQPPEALRVIQQTADERRCPLRRVEEPLLGYGISLQGSHQAMNGAVAVEALHALGIPLRVDAVRSGLATVSWPGRFDHRPAHRLVLDAAHNPDGARLLAETWREVFRNPPAGIIFSCLKGKDVGGILAPLRSFSAPLHLCPVDSTRALPVDDIASAAGEAGWEETSIHRHATLGQALAAAARHPGTTLLCGSLYLVGEAVAHFEGKERRPTGQ